jgi:hypothetical protein
MKRLSVAKRIFAARILVEEAIDHLQVQVVERIRLIAVDFTDHNFALPLKLPLSKLG